MPRSGAAKWVLLYTASALVIGAFKWSTIHDAHYWDALGCYVWQARFIALHTVDLAAYHQLAFLRPPMFTGLLALLMRTFGETRELLHGATFLVAALLLPMTFAVTRRLGGSAVWAGLAMALCAVSPMFIAQAGLVQSDLPATALATLAWLLLLSGRAGWFAVCASAAVLTKESSYFLCLPAAYLLWERAGRPGRPLFRWTVLRALWPAAVPGAVLVAWQLSQHFIIGHTFSPAYAGYIGPGNLVCAFAHSFLEGGRFVLTPLALWGLWPHLRGRGERPAELRATALAWATLPIVFCAPLPRYMLLSLPLLCALAALGVERMPARWRVLTSALTVALLLVGARGLWDYPDVAHLEASLAYREQLALHREAAQALRRVGARRVIATFPMFTVLSAPPEDGYLDVPLGVLLPTEKDTVAELCRGDFLVQAQDNTVAPALTLLQGIGAATLWRQLGPETPPPSVPLDGERDRAVRIYSIRCEGAPAAGY